METVTPIITVTEDSDDDDDDGDDEEEEDEVEGQSAMDYEVTPSGATSTQQHADNVSVKSGKCLDHGLDFNSKTVAFLKIADICRYKMAAL